jgi:hypothetical protein
MTLAPDLPRLPIPIIAPKRSASTSPEPSTAPSDVDSDCRQRLPSAVSLKCSDSGSLASPMGTGEVVALGDGRVGAGEVRPFYLQQGQTVLYSKFGFMYT